MSTRSTPRPAVLAQPGSGARHNHQVIYDDQGTIVRIAGSVLGIRGLARARLGDVVLAGEHRLPGEIIRLAGDEALAQVYEPANGLRAGDPAIATGLPLSVELGPGLLGSIVDGTARPLAALAGHDYAQPFLARGACLRLTAAAPSTSAPPLRSASRSLRATCSAACRKLAWTTCCSSRRAPAGR
jgi:hypothetical protein